VISDLWFPLWPYGAISGSTASIAQGTMRISRMVLGQEIKTVRVDATNTTSGASLQAVVYADTSTGPGALIITSSAFGGTNTGNRQAALSLTPGTYWIGVLQTGGVAIPLRGAAGANPYLSGIDNSVGATMPNCWTAPGPLAAAPNPFPMAGVVRTNEAAAIYLQAV
jgi:hypothetical protein